MENCAVNISEELRVAESKKETLRRSFDIAHSQANSVLVFTVQWKDLEEHFDLTKKSLEKLSNDVDLKIRLLDQRAKEIESKEIELVLVEKKIEDCTGELKCKGKELGLVQRRIGECNCELQLKENELNSLSESLNLKKEELSLAQEWINKCQAYQKELQLLKNLIEEGCDEIDLRKKKVGEVQRLIEEREKQLAFKESNISSIQTLIEDYEEVLKDKEKSYDEVKKSLILCETKLKCEKKELELTQSSFKELSVKFHSEEEKLELLQRKVRLHETEVESSEQMLDSKRKQQKKYSEDVELKKRERDEIRKNVEELSQDLASKDKQLKFVQQSIEECSKEFQWKKEELVSIEKTIAQCSKEVELKKNQLNLIQHESNLFQTRTVGYLKEFKEKEKHFDSLKKDLEDRLQDLEVKEREFEKRVKEFELREKEFDSIREAVHDRSKNLLLQVKIEDPENLTSSGRNLQSLLNQHLQKHDLIFCKVFDTIKRASDPALLVLDAMSGFFPPYSREGDLESHVSIIRRSCILLLEQLSTIAPEINAQVRDEAMKVAVEWKKKMRVAAENSLEVLGFLHLLAAYRLAPAFDGKEIESLLCIVAKHRQTPKLRQTLGFGDKVPGLLCSITAEGRSSPSMLVGTSAPTNQPLPCPMNLPKYSGMNPSYSTSSPVSQYSGVQPQLENQYKRLQRETAEGRRSSSMLVGTSAPPNQPVPCPMNLPKYSRINPSNSTSSLVSQFSGVQPQLENQYKRLQRETAEGRSSPSMLVGTSAPTNQPVPCPMNLPKYSGMNPSNSSSSPVSQFSGVQPQLENQYKCLQRETAEGRSSPSMLVGTSAPTNQPVRCPMNLPKYSRMNPSNSTPSPVSQYSGVQPQLENQYKRLQRETAEGRSSPSMLVGTSAPTNQPVPCPMNLPKYSGMNPSNSTSSPVSQYSGVQPQLGNQYKRLRRETAEGRSSPSMLVGTSAPTNQSVPCPMDLPKYSGINPSNSTSSPVSQFSGVQPQLENQYKRLQRETAEGRSSPSMLVGTSAPTNQSVPCPMDLPKYSGINPSNSTSSPVSQFSGVQPQLENQYKRLQRETAEGRSSPSMLVGTSAPTNQPVHCPMNLPKYSGMNPSNSTSSPVSQYSGVQPQLENQYKRLQRESPTIIAYTPQTPASDNLNRSSLATQYGPGEAHIGGQTQFGLLAANMADGESSNNKQENDPFLVHPSDSPTTVLVSPLLTGNNYGTWVRAMTMALQVRNKLSFVDGTITKPDDDDGGKWQRCNDLEHFQPTNESKIYELKQAISSLRQGDMPIFLYYCKMKKLWKKLNSLQHVEPCVSGNAKVVNELQHRDFGMEFLHGLHDRYTAIRSHILLMDPLPNVQKILTLVKEEETKHELHGLGGPPKAAALATQNRQPLLHSSLDNRIVHNISAESRCENLNVTSGNNQSRPTCEHCGKLGHTKLMCFELIGYPPNWKKRRRGT